MKPTLQWKHISSGYFASADGRLRVVRVREVGVGRDGQIGHIATREWRIYEKSEGWVELRAFDELPDALEWCRLTFAKEAA